MNTKWREMNTTSQFLKALYLELQDTKHIKITKSSNTNMKLTLSNEIGEVQGPLYNMKVPPYNMKESDRSPSTFRVSVWNE